ncbi:TIR domain-containing protein [bacterium]
MQAWKKNKNIAFNFTDCQLADALNSEDEAYIKRKCRERINMAGKYIMLIGKQGFNTRNTVLFKIPFCRCYKNCGRFGDNYS